MIAIIYEEKKKDYWKLICMKKYGMQVIALW
jgi:hypothetical protein